MIKIRYKIRINSPVIFWTVTAFATFFLSFVFPAFSCLLIIEALILLQRPRRFFVRRLNSYFITVHYPLSKWHGIFQSPQQSVHSMGIADCKCFYRDLLKQINSLFTMPHTGVYYRTITHLAIKRKIEAMESAGSIKILTSRKAYQRDITHIQKALLHNSCRHCPDAGRCKFRSCSVRPRQFYYIKFAFLKRGC